VLGIAWIEDALATLECRTVDTHQAGDHDIVVGEVVNIAGTESGRVADADSLDPLLYFQRRYRRIGSGEHG
jgi:flavin reductase (DIM6/NTAB) family NADH-FMN oxidoreductase RutF